MHQKTIGTHVEMIGIAPFVGKESSLAFYPAPPNTGIVFRKSIAAHVSRFVKEDVHTTSLFFPASRIQTTEHLLAAVYGLQIDNLYIDINGPGIPIIDATATDYAYTLIDAGLVEQDVLVRPLGITSKKIFIDKDSRATLTPVDAETLSVHATISFPEPIGKQEKDFVLHPESFMRDIVWARSFVRSPIDKIWPNGKSTWDLAKESIPILPDDPQESPVLCFDSNGWVTEPRSFDEPVRHKILDLIGDLGLVNQRIYGHIDIHWPGHEFNCKLAAFMVSQFGS